MTYHIFILKFVSYSSTNGRCFTYKSLQTHKNIRFDAVMFVIAKYLRSTKAGQDKLIKGLPSPYPTAAESGTKTHPCLHRVADPRVQRLSAPTAAAPTAAAAARLLAGQDDMTIRRLLTVQREVVLAYFGSHMAFYCTAPKPAASIAGGWQSRLRQNPTERFATTA